MEFLLQQEKASEIEKRVVIHASMLIDAKIIVRPGDSSIESCPVGSVEFVKENMKKFGIKVPGHMTYPPCLHRFAGRSILQMTWGDAKSLDNVFIKPRDDVKKFTGAIIGDLISDTAFPSLPDDYPVWVSEPVKFISEWRYYILHQAAIVGRGRYDDGADDAPEPDNRVVMDAVRAMIDSGEAVAGYALDFGVTQSGETLLVEANDGWALGYYKNDSAADSLSHVDYARLLHARWSEIVTHHQSQKPEGDAQ